MIDKCARFNFFEKKSLFFAIYAFLIRVNTMSVKGIEFLPQTQIFAT